MIVATGGDCAAGIGMGCNYWNSNSPTASIGKITITDSDVTASGGFGAAAIGFSISEPQSDSGTYRAGQITITTEDESGFLSKLTPGMNYVTTPQRIGKGSYNITPTFLNTAGTGPWEGVVRTGLIKVRPVRYVLLQSFVSCFSVLSILLFARRKRSIPHRPECMGGFFARRASGAGAASGCMKPVARPCKIGTQKGRKEEGKHIRVSGIFRNFAL